MSHLFEVPGSAPIETGIDVVGPEAWSRLLNRAFAVLTGNGEPNRFRGIVARSLSGERFFVNDNCWWIYTDAQCNGVSTFGFRPWFDDGLRAVDTFTWRMFLPHQSDGSAEEGNRIVPAGALPFNHNPGSESNPRVDRSFYANYFWNDPTTWHPDHDELVDFQLLHVVTIADSLLWGRDEALARAAWPHLARFLAYVRNRPRNAGLLLLGVQGSQIEFSHGTRRYSLTTQWYWLRALELLAEVADWIGNQAEAECCRDEARASRSAIASFRTPGGWYASARTEDRTGLVGDGTLAGKSGYFETHANCAPALFGVLPDEHASAIAERIVRIPEMIRNGIGVYNFPARPPEEIDDGARFPGPGMHVNGGWWWLTAGETMALLARARHPRTGELSAALFADHDARHTIDYYNEWGANKAAQWKDKRRPDQVGVTNVGAWGNLLRSLFGLHAGARTLAVRPRLPGEVDRLATRDPIRIGRTRLFVEVEQGNRDEASLDGNPVPWEPAKGALVPVDLIRDGSTVRITSGQ